MRQEMVGFWDAVASAAPYENKLHLTLDRQPHQHLITQFFKGRVLFLTPNQQCQSTESKYKARQSSYNIKILKTTSK